MKKLATVLAVLAALVWSALVWGGYVLLGLTGTFVAENAGMFALPPELVAWGQYLFASFGQGAAFVLWLLGLGLVGLVLLIVNAMIGKAAPPQPRFADEGPPRREGPALVPTRNPSQWGRNASGR